MKKYLSNMPASINAQRTARQLRVDCRDDIIAYIARRFGGEYRGAIAGIVLKEEAIITATQLYVVFKGKWTLKFIGLQMSSIGFRKSTIRAPIMERTSGGKYAQTGTKNISVWRATRIGHPLDSL
jgi:hypothetical protein